MVRGFLLDMGISPKALSIFKDRGLAAVHAKDAGLAQAQDVQIIDEARKSNWAIITTDNDFAAHVMLNPSNCPAIITLRMGNPSAQEQIDGILRILNAVSLDEMDNCIMTLDQNRLRRRYMPHKTKTPINTD